MLEKIIRFSLNNKLIIILFTATLAGFGIYALVNIPVGAVPDITNNQVQVITTSGNLSTQEIEQFITQPVELEMANLPGVQEIRSVSKFGLSVVTIVFDEKLGAYLPRQLIAEKIKSASENIPEGFGTPQMGPITTGLGEIYQYILDVKPGYENRYSATDLRTIQDWMVRRQLSGIPGVVEVNSWGGYLKQYEVAINPARLQGLNIPLMDVFSALEGNNSISGGAYIEKGTESYFIRGDGQAKSLADIENIVVQNSGGVPVLIRDVAEVRLGYANRYGAITANGEGEKVLGQIMMLKNANSKKVIHEVKKRVEEVQKNLPEGVYIRPILERGELISKTSFTVFENLILGCIIVMLVVILLLGNWRSALVIASMIPLALLFTLSMMYVFGIDANLMSLGALDFGIIIDGAVIIVEFVAVKLTAQRLTLKSLPLTQQKTLKNKITFEGASRMMNSAIFGQVIILIVFIPILSLQGVEGKMFRPMALAFSFAIIGAMLMCLTWLPVAISLFLKPEDVHKKNISDKIIGFAEKTYRPVLDWAMRYKTLVLGLSFFTLILSFIIFSNMGGEFVPTLDEGDFVIQPVLKTGTSLSRTVELTTQMEKILKKNFPEIKNIVCRIGAAEVPTDPMSMEEIDMIITLKPRKEWKSAKSKEALADKFKEALSVIPGVDYEFTQPIEMRFNELITGVRSDIAVKIFGEDLDYLSQKADEIKKHIETIPGAADVILEKTTGLPQMSVKYDRGKIAFYGMDTKTLNKYLAAAFGGEMAGSVFEGEKRFDLVLRLQKENRVGLDNIKQLQVPLKNGILVPLSELAEITVTEGPAKISRENTHRRVVVSVNVRNRDLQSVVKDIQTKIDENVKLSPGNYIVYGGQFENLQNATKRLSFAVPIALALIFIFLHFAFKSMKDALLIYTAVPLSVVGGIFALLLRGMPFSISAGVGFIALFGIAVLNGIVLIEHLKHLKEEGSYTMPELIRHGTVDRLRPVMLTAAAAAMGFLPMAVSGSAGAEVQRPLATVVIGGLITSTMLTMIVLPILFMLLHDDEPLTQKIKRKMKRIPRKTITTVVMMLVSAGFLSAQNGLTLEKAVETALKNNKELEVYRLRLEQRNIAASSYFFADKTKVYYGYDQANVAENGHPLRTVGVEQTLPFPTVYGIKNKLENQLVMQARFEFEKQKRLLIKNVTQTYYDICFEQLRKNNFQKIDSLYQKITRGDEIRYTKGDISKLDLLNAQARLQQVTLQLKEAQTNTAMHYARLKMWMQTEDSIFINRQEIEIIPTNFSEVEENPDFLRMKNAVEQMKLSAKIEKQAFLPDISLNYFYGNNRFENARGYHGFQVGVSIPLFFKDQQVKVKSANMAVKVAEMQLESTHIALAAKHQYLLNELKKQEQNIRSYRETGEKLADEILRAAEKSYQAGAIDFYQFAQSVENALKLTTDYYQSVINHNHTALEIKYLTLE